MRGLLQRRPFGFPLHLTLTHFTLAFALASVLLDVVAWLGLGARDTTTINAGAYAILLVALVGAVLAALSALAAALDLSADIRTVGWWYTGALALIASLDILNAILRGGSLRDQVVPPFPLFLSLAAIVILFISAWLGGTLAARALAEEVEQELEEPEPIRRRGRR